MLRGVAGKVGVTVQGGDTALPYVPMNHENPIQGMIRVWGTDLQVFNGSGWTLIPSSFTTVGLTESVQDLLEWVRIKKIEEEVLISFRTDHPAVKLARENINRVKQELARAEEQLKITEILIQDETTS